MKIKAPCHWLLWREFTGDRWNPRTQGQWRGKCFHLMTSSWKANKVLEVTPWALLPHHYVTKGIVSLKCPSRSRATELVILYLRPIIHICVLLLISRYLKILHPFQYERLVTHGRIIVAICLIWISTVSLGFVLTYPWHIFEPAFVCLPTYVLPLAVQVRVSHSERWWCHDI